MSSEFEFLEQIRELISANAWEKDLIVEADPAQKMVRIKLTAAHRVEPNALVGEYYEGIQGLEQVQSECLRALRTGRTGI